MFRQILGIGDFLVFFVILLALFLPQKWIIYAGLYLLIKGAVFARAGDIISWVDTFCGFYIIILSFGFTSTLLTIFTLIFIGQKTAFSLFL